MKYIAPDGWFSLEYPAGWHEFEDTEDVFLFYNPDVWSGNFRISASMGQDAAYGSQCVRDDLRQVRGARPVKCAGVDCAYYTENFREQGQAYTTHFWVMDEGEMCIECSFTAPQGSGTEVAEQILATVRPRPVDKVLPQEIIPVRVCEISEVNTAYEEISSLVKKKLSKDFTSSEEDIPRLQQLIDGDFIAPTQRQQWEALGITFGTILINEIDGLDWVSVIEGRKGYAALRFRQSQLVFNPAHWVWSCIKGKRPCRLADEYERILHEVEQILNA
jgi:hypothetical protein